MEVEEEIARRNFEHASKIHERRDTFVLNSQSTVGDNANLAVKSVFVLNGGASVALLAFTSSLVGKNSLLILASGNALVTFSIGIVFATMAGLLAYFTNYCYLGHSVGQKAVWTHPYFEETPRSTFWKRCGIVFHILAMLSIFAAIYCFLAGVSALHEEIQNLQLS